MTDISLTTFAQDAYKDYALYVLHDRALPRLIDGLKPVQRRLVFAMHQLHLDYKSKPKKSARTVGDVLGKFHPHSDQACYEALVNLSQPFTTRYPLLDGQGNFGSQDDPKSFAAMRYTEVKLSLYANLLLDELNDDVVPWQSNFDGTLKEPQCLPAQIPFLLANGCSGIAVGMSCEIPPFNIGEIIDALVMLLKNPKTSASDILEVLPGPDFPTGGVLKFSPEQILSFYECSQGSFILEGKYELDNKKIMITQLPYTVSTSRLIEQIQQLAQKKEIAGLVDLLDLSDHSQPVALECHFKTAADCIKGLKCLLHKTDLRRTYRSYFNILDENNVPGSMSLMDFLLKWLNVRKDVVLAQFKRRFRLIEERLHIINALSCIYSDLEQVIKIIRFDDDPWGTIASRYDLDETQIEALRKLRLSQLTKLNAISLSEEKETLDKEKIETYAVIQSPTKLKNFIKKQLISIKNAYADTRRTQLEALDFEQASELKNYVERPAVIKSVPLEIMITKMGWIKAFKTDGTEKNEYSKSLRSSDEVIDVISCLSTDPIALWDDKGRVYSLQAHNIPTTRFGEHLNSFISLPSGNHITFMTKVMSTLVITSELLTMRVNLESLALSNRGVKVVELDSSHQITHVHPLVSPYIFVAHGQGHAVLALEDIPLRKKGRGVLLVDRKTPPLEVVQDFYDTSSISLKKPRHKVFDKSFEELLIKRGGKLKKIPSKYFGVPAQVHHKDKKK